MFKLMMAAAALGGCGALPGGAPLPACAAGAAVYVDAGAPTPCDLGATNTLFVMEPGRDGDDPVVCDSGYPVVVYLPGNAFATAGCGPLDF